MNNKATRMIERNKTLSHKSENYDHIQIMVLGSKWQSIIIVEMMESDGKWWSVMEMWRAWQGEADCDGLVTKWPEMSEQDGKREERDLDRN